MSEILRTEHIVQRFGGMEALKDISMRVESGEIVGVIGPKRMNYAKVIGMINSLATGIDRIFNDGQTRDLPMPYIRTEEATLTDGTERNPHDRDKDRRNQK